MSEEVKTAQGSAATVEPSIKFKDMSFFQKLAFVSKAMVCIVSFGFAYPNIFTD